MRFALASESFSVLATWAYVSFLALSARFSASTTAAVWDMAPPQKARKSNYAIPNEYQVATPPAVLFRGRPSRHDGAVSRSSPSTDQGKGENDEDSESGHRARDRIDPNSCQCPSETGGCR